MRELLMVITAALVMMWPGQSNAQADENDLMAVMDTIWAGQLVEAKVLGEFDCLQLRIIRNTVYARHGFDFTNEWVDGHFRGDPRYVRVPGMDSESVEGELTLNDHATIQSALVIEDKLECSVFWETYGDPNGDSVLPPVGYRDQAETQTKPRAYVLVEIFADVEETIPTVIFDATPAAIYDWVMEGEIIQSDWIEPFTCEELARAAQAVYARHDYPFSDPQTEHYFSGLSVSYSPSPLVGPDNIERRLSNADDLNLLRIRRVARTQGCDPIVIE